MKGQGHPLYHCFHLCSLALAACGKCYSWCIKIAGHYCFSFRERLEVRNVRQVGGYDFEIVPYLMGCGGGKDYVKVKHQLSYSRQLWISPSKTDIVDNLQILIHICKFWSI